MTEFDSKFLVKNLITDVSQISDSASNADSIKLRIFDRNVDTKWVSTGETTGTRTITWTPSSAQTVDRIFLQNINWDSFTIKYDTSNDFTSAINVSGNTDTDIYIEVSSQSVTNIVISVTATFTAGDAAECGQVYFGTELFETTNYAGEPNNIQGQTAQKIFRLSDQTTKKVFIRRIFEYELFYQAVSFANRQNFVDLFERNRREDFVFIPRPKTQSDSWDGLANHYNWINGPDYNNFTNNLEINGYDVRISLAQSGGIG